MLEELMRKLAGTRAGQMAQGFVDAPRQAQEAREAAAARMRSAVVSPDRANTTIDQSLQELMIPQNAAELAMMALPGGAIARAGGKIGRKTLAGLTGIAGAGSYASEAEARPLGRLIKGLRLPVRPSTDDAGQALDATFKYGALGGDKVVPIDSLTSSAMRSERVPGLVAKMQGPEGYISRLLVDDAGNVVEGQHRLAALKQLGETHAPVTVLKDLSRGYDVDAMEKAVRGVGGLHGDQVKGVVQGALEAANEAGGASKALGSYDLGAFQKYFDAALKAAGGGAASLAGVPAAGVLGSTWPGQAQAQEPGPLRITVGPGQ